MIKNETIKNLENSNFLLNQSIVLRSGSMINKIKEKDQQIRENRINLQNILREIEVINNSEFMNGIYIYIKLIISKQNITIYYYKKYLIILKKRAICNKHRNFQIKMGQEFF